MQSVISVDIGTTAVKVSLIEQDGSILFNSVENYPTDFSNGMIEQDPENWWDALIVCLAQLRLTCPEYSAEAIVLSGQMQDLICISDGKLSGKAILYSDSRAVDEWKCISQKMSTEAFSAATMNTGDASIIPAKILWLKKHYPERVSKSVRFLLGAHDYICWKLTGLAVTDYTNASTTGLLNFSSNFWDRDILAITGITEGNLPELTRADTVTGTVTSSAASETGLSEGLSVIHGAGDAASSTVGAGAGVEGVYSGYLGTSGWIAATSDNAKNPETGIFNLKHPNPEKVLNIGPMLMTGGNVEWAVSTFLAEPGASVTNDLFESFTLYAESSPPGSSGILYLPYLSGERSPFMDSYARGAFVGMTKMSDKGDMFRAVLEGVSYSLRSIIDLISDGGSAERIINLSGGGAGNSLWAEILSSVTGADICTMTNARESGVFGNVIIAGNALGWFDSFEAPESFIGVEKRYKPDSKLSVFYEEGCRIFNNLYPALKSSFHDISSWSNK